MRWWKAVGQDELCQILFWRWDPIGVRDHFPASKGEYDTYAGPLMRLLREGGAVAEVVEHLRRVEIESMGGELSGQNKLMELGYFIVEWNDESLARWIDREP